MCLERDQWMARVTGRTAFLLGLIIMAIPACAYAQDDDVALPPALQDIQRNFLSSFDIEIPDIASFDPSVLDLEQRGVFLVWTAGRSGEGAAMLEEAIEKEPRLVMAPVNLAIYYEFFLADASTAATVLESAIAHSPDQPHLYLALANVQAGQGNHDAAIDHILQALKLGHRHASVYYNLGNAYSGTGNVEAAIENYIEAVAINPAHENARSNLILAFIRRGDVDRTLEYAGDDVELVRRAAISLGRDGYMEESLRATDRALELDPQHAETYFNRGVALGELGRHEEALESYERAITLNPDDAKSHFNQAGTLQQLDRLEEALAAVSIAVEVEPIADNYFGRGMILMALGRPEEAFEDFNRTFELEPNHAGLRQLRNRARRE